MLATGSPLAWLIEAWSWRAGFIVLAACSAASWVLIWRWVAEPASDSSVTEKESVGAAIRRFAALLTLPHTAGIVALAAVTYASFVTVRGLWLGPLLVSRHGFSLVQAGHVAFGVSLVAMVGPPLFGRLDPGPQTRRRWLVAGTLIIAALLGLVALNFGGRHRRRPFDGIRSAVGLHGDAVRRCARGLSRLADRSCAGLVHDGHVPGRGGDAVVYWMGRCICAPSGCRSVSGDAGRHFGAAGSGRNRVRNAPDATNPGSQRDGSSALTPGGYRQANMFQNGQNGSIRHQKGKRRHGLLQFSVAHL